VRRILTLGIIALSLISSQTPTAAAMRPETALDLIEVPWKELGYSIVFKPPRVGYRAMTFPAQHRIEIYARPKDDVALLAYDIAHELGHVIDVTYNTPETRKAWIKARGIDQKTPWFGCDRCSDYKTPAGDFAETFAAIICGPKYYRSRMASYPTAEQIPTLLHFFPKDFFRF
jgi:hypothetical protein